MKVKAWAVVCKNGALSRHLRVEFTPDDAEDWREYHDRQVNTNPPFKCGPHKVIPLTGEVEVARKAGRKA